MTRSDLTIRADIVAAGVGLPPVWCSARPREWWAPGEWLEWGVSLCEIEVDASDPQTALGLAMLLDAWELVADPEWFRADTWLSRVRCELQDPRGSSFGHREDMLAYIEHIGALA